MKKGEIYVRKIVSIILIIIAIISLLGAFGLTGLGRNMFTLFSMILGNMAWLIPFLCLALSFMLWPYYSLDIVSSRRHKKTRKKSDKTNEKEINHWEDIDNYPSKSLFSLPATKIVPIRGFDNYFASMTWSEKKDINSDRINELGNNFSTYFGEGQRSFIPSAKIISLRGLKNYIEEVDYEIKNELVNKQSTSFESDNKVIIPDQIYEEVSAANEPDTKTDIIKTSKEIINKDLTIDKVLPIANIPSRISFTVTSSIDSRTILDTTGVEKLLGKGNTFYSPQSVNQPQRVQGCLVNVEEVPRVIASWKSQGGPEYLDPGCLFSENKTEKSSELDDNLFLSAGQLFISSGIASVSYLQRRLKLGYTRAARLMDMLEKNGVVGSVESSKPRQILLTIDEFNERFGNGKA